MHEWWIFSPHLHTHLSFPRTEASYTAFFCRMFLIFILDVQQPKSHCIQYSSRTGAWLRKVNMQGFWLLFVCLGFFGFLVTLFMTKVFAAILATEAHWNVVWRKNEQRKKTNKNKQKKTSRLCITCCIMRILILLTKKIYSVHHSNFFIYNKT